MTPSMLKELWKTESSVRDAVVLLLSHEVTAQDYGILKSILRNEARERGRLIDEALDRFREGSQENRP